MKSSGLKDNIKKMFHILTIVYQLSKGYFYTFIIDGILRSLTPYVNILFTYLIIDGIIDHIPTQAILLNVYWMVGLNLGIGLLQKYTHYLRTQYVLEMNYKLDEKIAIKTHEIDYAQAEDYDIMNLIKQAKDGSNGSGGLQTYCEYVLGDMLISILSIIYGIILISRMFSKATISSNSWFIQFLNTPYSISMVVIALVISASISIYAVKKDNQKSYDVMMGNIEGNRRADYYFRIASNYQLGKDIRIFGMRSLIIEYMKDKKNSVDANWRSYVKFSIRLMILAYFGNFILVSTAYMYVGLKAIYAMITVGQVVSFVASITLISRSINDFLIRYSKMFFLNQYLEHYFTFLNLESNITYGDIDTFDEKNLEIKFNHVSFRYPKSEENVLTDLNFTLSNKRKVAIVGPNGAGKSTLVKLLCRLYDVTEGEILINQIPIHRYSKKALYRMYSIVFQDFKLYAYSIEDNLAFDKPLDANRMNRVLEQTGLTSTISKMEKGAKTILYQKNKESGVDVSGGEAQKIAIARALYKDSPLVILDEPTAALDPKSEAEIYEKFNVLVDQKTSIFISHRMSSTKFCDEIIVMDQGRLVEHGNHKRLILNQGLYHQMWMAQAKYYHE